MKFLKFQTNTNLTRLPVLLGLYPSCHAYSGYLMFYAMAKSMYRLYKTMSKNVCKIKLKINMYSLDN